MDLLIFLRLCGFLSLLLGLAQMNQAARILAYLPTPSKSHHYFFAPTLIELGRRGHLIDYYSPYPPTLMHPNVNHVEIENTMALFTKPQKGYWFERFLPESEKIFLHSSRAGIQAARRLAASTAVRNLLQSNVKYDLLIHEGYIRMEYGHVFAHKFNVSSVAILSYGDLFNANEFSGLVNNPAYMVNGNGISSTFTDRMRFFDRLYNTLSNSIVYPIVYYGFLLKTQRMIDECFTYPGWHSRPSLTELMSDQALILANSHHAVGYSYPKAPHYKEIGGGVLQPSKPLPEDLEIFMNQSTDGVIYFSLGTVVQLDWINSNLKHIFTVVFATRKERVLWKWSGEPLLNVSNNVKILKHFPQQDVLAHKNIKLFITHSGLQSSFEAIHFGVPMVIVPCYSDQIKNSLALEQAGYGVVLRPTNITENSLDWAIEEVLTNRRYQERVLKGSAMLNDRPMNSVDEATYWIEYVLRHGKILQPTGAKLSYVQLHCLDVYSFILITLIVAFCLTKKLLRVLRSSLSTRKCAVKRKED